MARVRNDVRVELDMFPAIVRLPIGTTLNDVRVTITQYGLDVWKASRPEPVNRYHRDTVLSIEGSDAGGYGIQVEDGIITAKRTRDCGCRSQLKYWNPWPGQRKVVVAR